MKQIFKINLLYIPLLIFIIFNLSCETDPYSPFEPEEDPYSYSFAINIEVEGEDGAEDDYAGHEGDQTS